MASLQLSAAREFCFKIPVYASRPCQLFGEDGHACSKDKGHAGGEHFCDCGYEWADDGLTFQIDGRDVLGMGQSFSATVALASSAYHGNVLSLEAVKKAEAQLVEIGPMLVEIAAEKTTLIRMHDYFKAVFPPPPVTCTGLTSIYGVPLNEDDDIEQSWAELRFSDGSRQRVKLW
jgi:hypothetical protein